MKEKKFTNHRMSGAVQAELELRDRMVMDGSSVMEIIEQTGSSSPRAPSRN